MSATRLSNLVGYDEYINEDLLDEFDFDIDENDDLYEMRKLTSAEEKRKEMVISLMKVLNKRPGYSSAKAKFMKVFHIEAKKAVAENGLNPKVLKDLNKVTLREIE